MLFFLLLQGFKAIIDTKNEYPLTSRDPILIKAGQVVLIQVDVCYHSYIQLYLTLQNVVSLGATKVTPNENIESINPEKRQCFFDYEHPPNYPLKAHQKYSQVEILPFSQ